MGALNARISLRYDTYENWSTASAKAQVLNKGEVGICSVTREGATQPVIMFKVGDGNLTFAQLPWTSGLAADVYGWAKEAGIYIESTEGTIISNIAWDNTLNSGKGGIKVTRFDPTIEEDDYATTGMNANIDGSILVFTDAARQKAVKSITFN